MKTVNADTVIFTAPNEGVATGRNGTMRVSGLRAWRSLDGKLVTIEPWTSRGQIGNCRIVVPTAELQQVTDMLRGMLEPETPAPAVIQVTVKGGVVQDVTGIPPGVTIQVHDYDVEGDEGAGNHTCRVCGETLPLGIDLRGHLAGHHAGADALDSQDVLAQFDTTGEAYRLIEYRGLVLADAAPSDAVQATQLGLLNAAKRVLANWEHGDLAAAVRELAAALATTEDPAQAAHRLNRGRCCPACGSGDICGYSFEYDHAEHWQEVNCWTCGASWTDVYRLAEFGDLKRKEPAA